MSVWRYMPGGTVKHRLATADETAARCGVRPWGLPWLGGGSSIVELVLVGALPECRNCVRWAAL